MAFGDFIKHRQIDWFYDLFWDIFDLFFLENMTVTKITPKVFNAKISLAVHRCFLVTSRPSSQMGHFDLFYDLFLALFDLFFPENMTVTQITPKVFNAKSSLPVHRCFWVTYRPSSQFGHIDLFYDLFLGLFDPFSFENMTVIQITPKGFNGKLSFAVHRCF